MSISYPKANKNLGQHYLKCQTTIAKICSDFAKDAQYIIEIGPGPGVLTKSLKLHKKPFQVIEKDSRFVPNLKEHLTGDQILITDALEVDLAQYFHSLDWQNNIWLVSNLPYNISAPLMIHFTPVTAIKFMTLMMQKEVGEKVYNWSGVKKVKQMGPLMGLMQNYFDISLKCPVSPGAFSPPPKVDSVVLSFTRKENPEVELEHFENYQHFLRTLFHNRRKQMANVAKNSFKIEAFEAALRDLGKKLTDRAETLDIHQCALLYKGYHKHLAL